MYSFKLKTKGQVISKQHVQDWLMKDTPGAGNYEPRKLDLGRKYTISRDERFR
jgi:hypothetical protein